MCLTALGPASGEGRTDKRANCSVYLHAPLREHGVSHCVVRAEALHEATLLAGLGSEELAHNGIRPSPRLSLVASPW